MSALVVYSSISDTVSWRDIEAVTLEPGDKTGRLANPGLNMTMTA